MALAELGRREEAVALYQKALQLRPDYAEAAFNLGNALRELGRLDEAIAWYRQASALRPDFPEALDNLGSAAITGTFAGLPEGAKVTINGTVYTISYKGGNGKSVVLTRIS